MPNYTVREGLKFVTEKEAKKEEKQDASGGGLLFPSNSHAELADKIRNMKDKHFETLRDVAHAVHKMGGLGQDTHKGACMDIMNSKDKEHLAEMVDKDKEFGGTVGGSFWNTLKKIGHIAKTVYNVAKPVAQIASKVL